LISKKIAIDVDFELKIDEIDRFELFLLRLLTAKRLDFHPFAAVCSSVRRSFFVSLRAVYEKNVKKRNGKRIKNVYCFCRERNRKRKNVLTGTTFRKTSAFRYFLDFYDIQNIQSFFLENKKL
jgi:hypothetical protein